MSKLISIYGKTIGLVTSVFLVSFTVLALAFLSISASEERDQVRDLERLILMANSEIRDFMITKDPSQAKETELILQQANKIVEEGIRTENYQRLRNEVLMYLHSINNLIEIYRERGFYEDDGVEGRINRISANIESRIRSTGQNRAMIALLETRRQEKNYLLRGSEEAISGVHAGIDVLMSELTSGQMNKEEIAIIFEDLGEYQHSFDKLVSLNDSMEWTRSQLVYFKDAIGETLQSVIQAEKIRARRYLWSSLALIFAAFFFGTLYAFSVARDILKPLGRLRHVIRRMVDGEVINEEEVQGVFKGELAELMSSFEEVTLEVKRREDAEKRLQVSKDAVEQYATELESRTRQLDEAIVHLGEAKQEAELASRRKAEFLASMSHEIRTPLNGIIGMSSLLSTDSLKSDQKEIVDIIRTSGESLLGIVNHILDFSKIEAGGVILERLEFDVSECAEEAISTISRQAAEKDLDISYTFDSSVPRTVFGDPSRVKQVLVNLLANAVKFTSHGEIHIAVSRGETHGEIVDLDFKIVDTGVGISKEQQQFLFSPFEQADASTSRMFGGTGLGLSISQGLVHLMGGKMSLSSSPGNGSTFGFSIKVEISTESVLEGPPEMTGHLVLLLNESPLFGRALDGMFLALGVHMHEATTDVEAFKSLQTNPYAAVFINEGKNGFDGVAAAAIAGMLKGVAPDVPIVVMRFIDQNMLSGSTQLILKPVKKSSLKMLVNRLLIATQSGQHATSEPENELSEEPVSETGPKQETAGHAFPKDTRVDRSPLRRTKPSVLLVEDNVVNQKVGVRMLEKIGCEVDVVDSGAKAIQAVQSGKYTVVFMDIQMPDMDGLEATRRIRSLGDIVQPTIIALTAKATTEDRAQCLNAGMDDYATKPVSAETLDKILRKSGTSPSVEGESLSLN